MSHVPRLLVLPGAQKAGTTVLWASLLGHPSIHALSIKEPFYFSLPVETFSARAAWYRGLFPRCIEDGYILDASTTYLSCPRAPARVSQASPGARVVVVLRDPARRAYSGHQQVAKRTRPADRRSLAEVVRALHDVQGQPNALAQLEAQVVRSLVPQGVIDGAAFGRHVARFQGQDPGLEPEQSLWPYRYLTESLYSLHLPAWERSFGQRVRVVFFEELVREPGRVLAEVVEFLGLPPPEPPLVLSERRNVTVAPRNAIARQLLRWRLETSLRHVVTAVRRLAPGVHRRLSHSLVRRPKPGASELQTLRLLLASEYEYWLEREPRVRDLWDGPWRR